MEIPLYNLFAGFVIFSIILSVLGYVIHDENKTHDSKVTRYKRYSPGVYEFCKLYLNTIARVGAEKRRIGVTWMVTQNMIDKNLNPWIPSIIEDIQCSYDIRYLRNTEKLFRSFWGNTSVNQNKDCRRLYHMVKKQIAVVNKMNS